MKKITLLVLTCTLGLASMAQLKNPVKWTYAAKKINATNYELRFTAQIDRTWHIYTIDHKGDIGVATSFTINTNPLATTVGNVSTTAKALAMKDPSTGTNVKFYEGQVVFIQKIKLKAPVKTNITGTVEFMACDDKQCLAPTTKAFNIDLQ